ncbi:hypothetical protein Dsin_023497 [Dipteronia sinensis]|uniref:Pectinesterase inhibitor domain-containing protein n=1 Tax=Dipteronia sinensis TaxID=43782 RepID=A0AAE0E255_9ROSI|nr:hypothetical protein Dsin_023497 [Dipteronia sinensis]
MSTLGNHLLLLSSVSIYFFFILQFQPCFSINVPPLINQICTKTKNHNFCVQTLTSAPGAANANLTTLASFSFRSTYAAVATTDAFLVALQPNVTDPRVKLVVTHCRTDYDGSIPPLQLAITSLDGGHFDDVNLNVNQALANINDCHRLIKVGPPPPGLREKSTHVVRLVDISGVISVKLLHQ